MNIINCAGCNKELRVFSDKAECPFCYTSNAKEYILSMSEALLEYYSRQDDSVKDNPVYLKDYDPAKQLVKELKSKTKITKVGELGVRHNADKYKMSLISPQFLEGLAKVLTDGEKKYGKENLTKGNYVSVPYDSAMRHLHAFMKGENLDSESGSHHLFHATANLMMMYLYHTKPELDDRSFKDEEE